MHVSVGHILVHKLSKLDLVDLAFSTLSSPSLLHPQPIMQTLSINAP